MNAPEPQRRLAHRLRSRLGLRGRLALMSAAAVALSITGVSVIAWTATRESLYAQIDDALTAPRPSDRLNAFGSDSGADGADRPAGFPGPPSPEDLCGSGASDAGLIRAAVGTLQLVRANGSTCSADPSKLVPVTEADVATAAGEPGTALRTALRADGTPVRMVTVPLAPGYAALIARDLTEIENTLASLRLILALASGLGVLGALLAGLVIARTGLRPVDQLTTAAERVAATTQLDEPIDIDGHDEVARLAKAFNKMVTALTSARERQHRMVADASHELRTPLTSLRTNVELLLRSEDQARSLPPADRRELLHSLAAQLEELTKLTAELSLLAHDDPGEEELPVRLDDVVRRAVTRASHRGDHVIDLDLEPWISHGNPHALERAVLNLIDNAIKFSPPASTVRVRLHEGVLQVADQGPGIPPYEREQIFDRFWRSPSSRSMQGSGLGLAIVADVAASHGGAVWAGVTPEGGALLSFRVPGRAHAAGPASA